MKIRAKLVSVASDDSRLVAMTGISGVLVLDHRSGHRSGTGFSLHVKDDYPHFWWMRVWRMKQDGNLIRIYTLDGPTLTFQT